MPATLVLLLSQGSYSNVEKLILRFDFTSKVPILLWAKLIVTPSPPQVELGISECCLHLA